MNAKFMAKMSGAKVIDFSRGAYAVIDPETGHCVVVWDDESTTIIDESVEDIEEVSSANPAARGNLLFTFSDGTQDEYSFAIKNWKSNSLGANMKYFADFDYDAELTDEWDTLDEDNYYDMDDSDDFATNDPPNVARASVTWAVMSMVYCLPMGVIILILALRVRKAYNNEDVATAEKLGKIVQNLSIITIVLASFVYACWLISLFF